MSGGRSDGGWSLSRPLLGPFEEVVHMFARIMAVAVPIGVAGVFFPDALAAMTPVHPKTDWRASINKTTVGWCGSVFA